MERPSVKDAAILASGTVLVAAGIERLSERVVNVILNRNPRTERLPQPVIDESDFAGDAGLRGSENVEFSDITALPSSPRTPQTIFEA